MIRLLFLLLTVCGAAAAEPAARPLVSEAALSRRLFPHLEAAPEAALRFTPEQIATLPEEMRAEAAAVNRIIAIYGRGEAPRHPEIDGPAFPAGSPEFAALVKQARDGADPARPALSFALRLLEANGRDEAARFWPLDTGENAPAIRRVASLDWPHFPYSLILVPGAGPATLATPLSAKGDERLRLAVEAWREGLAPYLLVSGGYVHPARTPYCEAIEMRRRLEEAYGVPADAILIDPQARHTTTNLRNAARQVFDYGLPADKPMLIVSDVAQLAYMESPIFYLRDQAELGYQPAMLGRRLSPTRLEAMPSRRSLTLDAAGDPLDP